MPKRKLNADHEAKGNESASVVLGRKGKLLKHRQDDQRDNEINDDDAVLHSHLVRFVDGSGSNLNNLTAEASQSFHEAITALAGYLEKPVDRSNESLPSQIAQLVLPWTIRQLIHETSNNTQGRVLYWKLFDISIHHLIAYKLEFDEDLTNLRSILTQSSLAKILPTMGLLALRKDSVDDGKDQGALSKHAASAFCLLIDSRSSNRQVLFHPTLEVALNSLLLPMINAFVHLKENAEHATKNQDQSGIQLLKITINWILQSLIMSRGNPKTTFHLLVQKPVMIALSRLHFLLGHSPSTDTDDVPNLVRKMISHGLFNVQHNMEGLLNLFRRGKKLSNDKRASFRCYQDELVSAFDTSISVSEWNEDTKHVARILPLLLDEFILQHAVFDKATSKRGGMDASLSFEMYRRMVTPLLVLLGSKLLNSETVISPLKDLTGLLVTHGVYLASQDDSNQTQTKFLRQVVAQILDFSNNELVGESVLADCTQTFQHLTELSHHLVHERLNESIYMCCRGSKYVSNVDESMSRLAKIIESYFSLLAETYKKLRQQTHLIKSLLLTISALKRKSTSGGTEFLSFMVKRTTFRASLQDAIESSPLAEIQGTFRVLEQWLSVECSLAGDRGAQNDEGVGPSVAAGIGLSLLVFRSIRVSDTSTASSIVVLIGQFTKEIVQKLADDGDSARMQCALELCAWVIQLQQRCAFWLGREKQLTIPQNIEDEVERVSRQSQGRSAEALLLLASHRLQQIIYLVHDEELSLLQVQKRESESEKLEQLHMEGERLASLLASAGDLQISPLTSSQRKRKGWLYVAECAHLWGIYATDAAIDDFLEWLMTALARAPTTEACWEEERHVAIQLLQDASFLDLQRFGQRLYNASLVPLYPWCTRVLESHPMHSEVLSKELAGISKRRTSLMAPDERFQHLKLLDSLFMKHPEFITTIDEDLVGYTNILCFVNELPKTVVEVGDTKRYAEAAVMLEWIIASSSCSISATTKNKLSFISALRLSLVKSIHMMAQKGYMGDVFAKGDHLETFTDHLLCSTANFSCSEEIVNTNEFEQVILTTEKLVSAITSELISRAAEQHGLPHAMKGLSNHTSKYSEYLQGRLKDSSVRRLMPLLVTRAFLRASDSVSGTGSLDGKDGKEFLKSIWYLCFDMYHKDSGVETIGTGDFEESYGNLVLEELIQTARRWELGAKESLDQLESIVGPKLNRVREGQSLNTTKTIHFCLVSLIRARPSVSYVDTLIFEMSRTTIPSPLLEAAFCDLVISRLRSDERIEAIQLLLSVNKNDSTSRLSKLTRLRLLLLLLHRGNDTTAGSLASHGRSIFQLALQSLCPIDRTSTFRKDEIGESVQLLQSLIRRKDVLTMSQKDLSVVMCCLNSVIGGHLSRQERRPVPLLIFVGCCKTLLLLVQRFGKQLYPCVPLMISVLHSVMNSCLHLSADENLRSYTSEFTRLCESLVAHREVYRKHVVGLILDFTNHLGRNNMPHIIKDALLPSIYCLLDMLTIHETKQLNAMMDVSCKSIFRSVYRSYKKLHAYKG